MCRNDTVRPKVNGACGLAHWIRAKKSREVAAGHQGDGMPEGWIPARLRNRWSLSEYHSHRSQAGRPRARVHVDDLPQLVAFEAHACFEAHRISSQFSTTVAAMLNARATPMGLS